MSEHRDAGGWRVWGLAVWLGLLTGCGEGAWFALQVYAGGEPIRASHHTPWMSAASNAALWALGGAALAAGHALVPRLLAPRVVLGLLGFAWGWSQLRGFATLHVSAQLVLAVAIAVVVARLAGPRAARWARRTWWVLAGLVLAACAALHLQDARAEASPVPAEPGALNVVLVVLDTVRAKSLSLHGYERPTTPRLEELARGGVVFDRCLSTAPWTLPAHGSMFTGQYAYEQGIGWETPLGDRFLTLAEVLTGHGYATAGFVGNLLYCGREFGLARGFAHYRDHPRDALSILASSSLGREVLLRLKLITLESRNDAPTVVGWFTDWLDHRDPDAPFFAFLNLFDAHALYQPPEGFRFGPVTDVLRRGVRHRFSPEEMQVLVDAYDGCIAFTDHWVGRLVDELGQRGLREDTIVIVTSDHGEQLGEHGLTDHGNSLYRPLLHVPLLICLPGGPGLRVAEPVTLRDLPATVLDLVGVPPETLPGASLAPHWDSSRAASGSPILATALAGIRTPDWFPNTAGELHSVTAEGMHFIRDAAGGEELYDLLRDRDERANLIETPRGREVAGRLRAILETWTSR